MAGDVCTNGTGNDDIKIWSFAGRILQEGKIPIKKMKKQVVR